MAKFPKLPLWTDALISDTYHLTPAEFGAYMRLLIAAWRRSDCALPNDDNFLARIVGDPKSWHRLKKVLSFFELGSDNMFRQKRLLDERESCAAYAARQSAAGKANALKRHNRDATTAQPRPQPKSTPIPIPNTSKKEEESNPPLIPPKGEPKPKSNRGTRWPSGQEVPAAWIIDGARERSESGLEPIDLQFEAKRFQNYWAAKSGGNASKRDWQKTWINWTLNAINGHKINGNGYGKPERGNSAFIEGCARAADYEMGQPDDHEAGTGGIAGEVISPLSEKPNGRRG